MRRGWQVACIALALGFVLFAFESLRLSLSDALGPGPGFFPFWLSALGGVLALVLLFQASTGGAQLGSESLTFERAGVRRVASVLAGLIAATALLELAGFRLATLVLLASLLVTLGVRNWAAVALFALAGSFGVYHVFFKWLKVPLPVGILGF